MRPVLCGAPQCCAQLSWRARVDEGAWASQERGGGGPAGFAAPRPSKNVRSVCKKWPTSPRSSTRPLCGARVPRSCLLCQHGGKACARARARARVSAGPAWRAPSGAEFEKKKKASKTDLPVTIYCPTRSGVPRRAQPWRRVPKRCAGNGRGRRADRDAARRIVPWLRARARSRFRHAPRRAVPCISICRLALARRCRSILEVWSNVRQRRRALEKQKKKRGGKIRVRVRVRHRRCVLRGRGRRDWRWWAVSGRDVARAFQD